MLDACAQPLQGVGRRTAPAMSSCRLRTSVRRQRGCHRVHRARCPAQQEFTLRRRGHSRKVTVVSPPDSTRTGRETAGPARPFAARCRPSPCHVARLAFQAVARDIRRDSGRARHVGRRFQGICGVAIRVVRCARQPWVIGFHDSPRPLSKVFRMLSGKSIHSAHEAEHRRTWWRRPLGRKRCHPACRQARRKWQGHHLRRMAGGRQAPPLMADKWRRTQSFRYVAPDASNARFSACLSSS